MDAGDTLIMVVHGPDPFDCGDVGRLLASLGDVRIIVAGVMGRTAAEESGLPCEYCGVPPSQVLARLDGPAFLLNRGKTPESGRIFGRIVAGRLGRGLVHIECTPGTVFCWNDGDTALAARLATLLDYTVEEVRAAPPDSGSVREIGGCAPGEPVFVNGIVIGRATGPEVVLRERGDRIEAVSGIEIKEHGLEKLFRSGPVSLAHAWCKSGQIRQRPPTGGRQVQGEGRVIVLDHCGHRFYERLAPETCGVLAIGDDTTAVAGHIAGHLGIPVLGITDGDRDGVVNGTFPKGSVVLAVTTGRDDEVGLEIAGTVPDGKTDWDKWVSEALRTVEGRAEIVLDQRRQS
ncbi:MAG: DUF2117 domain-containing protein [Methanofollis sp.]|uniref:DUF2117 domain-containing protein n=1 Tax=Methanofollis sp. TaxID=2052835 RepID=UPI002606EFB6|nr:DUF2117 domain-containing protein [Methanofollis sp.]MDD4255196.1 DUF2117 domain-containing protein [Methanofollis sp.]